MYILSRDAKNLLNHVLSEVCSEGSDGPEDAGIPPAQEQCVTGGEDCHEGTADLQLPARGKYLPALLMWITEIFPNFPDHVEVSSL